MAQTARDIRGLAPVVPLASEPLRVTAAEASASPCTPKAAALTTGPTARARPRPRY